MAVQGQHRQTEKKARLGDRRDSKMQVPLQYVITTGQSIISQNQGKSDPKILKTLHTNTNGHLQVYDSKGWYCVKAMAWRPADWRSSSSTAATSVVIANRW